MARNWLSSEGSDRRRSRLAVLSPIDDQTTASGALALVLQHSGNARACGLASGCCTKRVGPSWTSMLKWQPQGVRPKGNGRCQSNCKHGYWGQPDKHGKRWWAHKCTIAQDSKKLKGKGKERLAMKMAMPVPMHMEILREILTRL